MYSLIEKIDLPSVQQEDATATLASDDIRE